MGGSSAPRNGVPRETLGSSRERTRRLRANGTTTRHAYLTTQQTRGRTRSSRRRDGQRLFGSACIWWFDLIVVCALCSCGDACRVVEVLRDDDGKGGHIPIWVSLLARVVKRREGRAVWSWLGMIIWLRTCCEQLIWRRRVEACGWVQRALSFDRILAYRWRLVFVINYSNPLSQR